MVTAIGVTCGLADWNGSSAPSPPVREGYRMWHALATSTLYLPFSRGGSALPMPILHMRLPCLVGEGQGGGWS